MKTKTLNILLILFSFILLCACDNNKTTPNEISAEINPELYTITIGAVVNNSTYTVIPLEIFGGTQNSLDGATLDIYFNGALLISALQASQFYKSSTNDVRLALEPVSAEKTIGFEIFNSDGSSLYYEGQTTTNGESQASLTVQEMPEESDDEILNLFDEKQSATGTATGTAFSGEYHVTFGTFYFSNDCTTDFLKTTGFYINDPDFYDNSDLSDEEISAMIAGGTAGFEIMVTITQTDSSFTWEPVNSTTGTYAGVVNADGTWNIFDGIYQNESNYTYKTVDGSNSEDADSFSGTLSETLFIGSTGSCTVTAEFNGIK